MTDDTDFKPLACIGSADRARDLMRSDRMKDALLAILPQFSDDADPDKHAERLIAQAGLVFMANPKLKQVTELSFFDSMMHVAETGLSLSRQSGEAYLVPFADNRRQVSVCTFMPGYRGLIKLATQTGSVQGVDAVAVFDGEDFDYWEDEHGSHIKHVPNLDDDRKDEGIKYVYSRIRQVGGGTLVRVMNRKQVERIRQGSKNPNGTPWRLHWGEMAMKTVIKRGLKLVPQSTSDKASRILEHAIDLDNRAAGFEDADLEVIAEQRQAEKQAEWDRRMGGESPEPERAEDGEIIPPGVGQEYTDGAESQDA